MQDQQNFKKQNNGFGANFSHFDHAYFLVQSKRGHLKVKIFF